MNVELSLYNLTTSICFITVPIYNVNNMCVYTGGTLVLTWGYERYFVDRLLVK